MKACKISLIAIAKMCNISCLKLKLDRFDFQSQSNFEVDKIHKW